MRSAGASKRTASSSASTQRSRRSRRVTLHADDGPAPLVLAFSGGGIRSASFCLGGFNALQDMDSTRGIDAMVAVSGGSYAASAIALTRSYAGDGTRPAAAARDGRPAVGVLALDSPELAYLRRNSRYIFQPWWRTLSGIWQMLGGALLNIFLAVAALRFFAWLVGWYSRAVGIVSDLDGRRPAVHRVAGPVGRPGARDGTVGAAAGRWSRCCWSCSSSGAGSVAASSGGPARPGGPRRWRPAPASRIARAARPRRRTGRAGRAEQLGLRRTAAGPRLPARSSTSASPGPGRAPRP